MIDNLPTYPQWRWKSLLLMAKNYAGLQDDFQANYTLDYIIDNAEGAIVAEAQQFKSDLARQRAAEEAQAQISDTLEVAPTEIEELEELDQE
jgi:hypothetical protein